MASYTTYNTASVTSTIQEALIKEQVGDLITNLFPLDTPLQQILEKVPMNHVFMEQPVDTFSSSLINRAASVFSASASFATTSAKPEGFTFSDITPQYPGRLKSVAEIQGSQFAVSDTDRAMSMYGLSDRFAYEALKHTEACVNQTEMSFWWSPGTAAAGADLNSTGGDAQQVARQTQGICHWALRSGLQRSKYGLGKATVTDGHGNNFGTTNAALNTGASTWAYDAGGLTLDQAMFKDNLMGQWYTITGRQAGSMGFCGAKIKNLFSQFALTANGAINERTLDAASKRVVDTVDYYETDFGVVSLNLCRYLNISGESVSIPTTSSSDGDGTAVTVPYDEILLFMQPRYFQIGVVRPVYMSPLGKTGDFERGIVRGEQALICRNPQAATAIVNCIP